MQTTMLNWLASANAPVWVGSIGTVGALIFLGIQARLLAKQTRELHEQSQAAVTARQEDEKRRLVEFRIEHTPFLSVEPGKVDKEVASPLDLGLEIEIKIHADGAGAAHNIVVNLVQVRESPPWETIAITTHPFLRAPNTATVMLTGCTWMGKQVHIAPELAQDEAQWFRLEVRYRNMFGESIQFWHSARFRRRRLEVTDAPTYTWPWESLQ